MSRKTKKKTVKNQSNKGAVMSGDNSAASKFHRRLKKAMKHRM